MWSGDRRRRRRGRPAARRHPHRGALVGVDLLRQRPGRHRRVRALAALRAGVAGAEHATSAFDIAGAVVGHRRADRARLRDRQGARRSAGARPSTLGLGARRDRPARRVRGHRAALERAAGPPRHLPDPLADARRTSRARSSPAGCSRCSSSPRSTCSEILGYRPLEAGLAFLPVTVGIGIGAASRSSSSSASTCAGSRSSGCSLAAVGLCSLAGAGRRHLPRPTSCRGCSRCRSAWA